MSSRPARQRWFDRSRSVFAVDVTDRPTARVDPHTHTRERNHRALRSRATPERVTVSRDAVVSGQSSIAFTRSVAARTHTKNTQKTTIPSTLYIHRPTRTPSRLLYGHLAPTRTRWRRCLARRAIKTRRVREITGYDSSIEADEDTTRAFSPSSSRIVAPWSSLRSVERPRERGQTVGRVKK